MGRAYKTQRRVLYSLWVSLIFLIYRLTLYYNYSIIKSQNKKGVIRKITKVKQNDKEKIRNVKRGRGVKKSRGSKTVQGM